MFAAGICVVNRPLARVAIVTIALRLAAQSPPVPYAQFFGPDFDNLRLDHSYPRFYQSIRRVDFRNMKLVAFDAAGRPDAVLQLKDGSRKWSEKSDVNEARLEEVAYLTPSDASGPEYALLMFHWISIAASSDSDGFAQVFRLSAHSLRVVQQLRWNEQFETREKYTFDTKTNTLFVRSAHYMEGDAHCCVSAMDVFTLEWNGDAFVLAGKQTELSDYGKREGKTLPR
jgi:hypothetical protein